MPHLQAPPAIGAADLTWVEVGLDRPENKLHAHINIAGTDMHLEAWLLQGDENDPETVERNDDFQTLMSMMDCEFEETQIMGRRYFLLATPYGR